MTFRESTFLGYPTTQDDKVILQQLPPPCRLDDDHRARVTCHESGTAWSSVPDIQRDDNGKEPPGGDVPGGGPETVVSDLSCRPPALHAQLGGLLLDLLTPRPCHQIQLARQLSVLVLSRT